MIGGGADSTEGDLSLNVVSSGLFELDRDRYTCSSFTAPMDMMLNLIGKERGRAICDQISEAMLCERVRDGSDRQRMPLRMRLGSSQPKLVEAVESNFQIVASGYTLKVFLE